MKGKTLLNDIGSEVTNVYRTEQFIVYQSVHVCYGDTGNMLISEDVYHARTPERDAAYEKTFGSDSGISKRKRMKVAAYTRVYVD